MAFEASQKYKEGKFIIEKARLLKVGALVLCQVCQAIHCVVLVCLADDCICCTGGQLVAIPGVEYRHLARLMNDPPSLSFSAHEDNSLLSDTILLTALYAYTYHSA